MNSTHRYAIEVSALVLLAASSVSAQQLSPYGNPISPAPGFAPGVSAEEGARVWADMHAYHCQSQTSIRRDGYTIMYDDYDVLEGGSVCFRNQGRVRSGARPCSAPVRESPSGPDCAAAYSLYGRHR